MFLVQLATRCSLSLQVTAILVLLQHPQVVDTVKQKDMSCVSLSHVDSCVCPCRPSQAQSTGSSVRPPAWCDYCPAHAYNAHDAHDASCCGVRW
jgi:hypothetical protein